MSNYYVATNGSDSNPGTISRPFATLKKAHDTMPDKCGGNIYLRGGSYDLAMDGWNWTKSGRHDNPLVVQSFAGEAVTLTNGYREHWTKSPDGTYWKYNSSRQSPLVIPQGQRPAVASASLADFMGWTSSFPVFWYDPSGTIYYRGPTTDPNEDLILTTSQFSIYPCDYYQFIGMRFRYGLYVHQQAGGQHYGSRFQDCDMRFMSQGIVGGGTKCSYVRNVIHRIGPDLMYRNGKYSTPYLGHCLYLNGYECLVTGNILSSPRCGGCMQLYPDGLNYSSVKGNLLLDADHSIFMGNETDIEGNILVNAGSIGPFEKAANFRMRNNYIEDKTRLIQAYFPSKITGGDIRGNILNCTETEAADAMYIDPSYAAVDQNAYIGPHAAGILNHQRTKGQDLNSKAYGQPFTCPVLDIDAIRYGEVIESARGAVAELQDSIGFTGV